MYDYDIKSVSIVDIACKHLDCRSKVCRVELHRTIKKIVFCMNTLFMLYTGMNEKKPSKTIHY